MERIGLTGSLGMGNSPTAARATGRSWAGASSLTVRPYAAWKVFCTPWAAAPVAAFCGAIAGLGGDPWSSMCHCYSRPAAKNVATACSWSARHSFYSVSGCSPDRE